MSQLLPSSSSSSPFTPKRSRITRKSDGQLNSVSRSLTFDDSNSIHLPFNSRLEFSPLSQQVSSEYDQIDSQQTTPVKTQQSFVEKNNKIILSPNIKNRPNRFNIDQQEKNIINPSCKRSGSQNSTPSKKIKKSSYIANCNLITHYFKPILKQPNFISDIDAEKTSQIGNFKKSEFSTDNVVNDKLELFNKIISIKNSSQSLNLKTTKNKSPKENCIENQVTRYFNLKESPIKTPSKFLEFQMLPSSSSSSSFTPKKSRIIRKNSGQLNSVSRSLTFDDSNSVHLPFNGGLEFLPLSEQLSSEYEQINSQQTTPVKTQQSFVEKNNTITLFPNIENLSHPINIVQQNKNTVNQSLSKRNSTNNSIPSKSGIANCDPIKHYFKPTQKRPNFLIDMNNGNTFRIGNVVKSEFSNQNKNENINNIQSPTNLNKKLNHKTGKKNSPRKKAVKSPLSMKNISDQLYVAEPVTPSKNLSIPTMRSPNIDYLKNGVIISGGDTYSRFIKSIVLKFELLCIGNSGIITTIYNCSNDELKIYGRLISRKHGWIRSDEPDGLKKYKELNLCDDFDDVLTSLATKQLINTGIL